MKLQVLSSHLQKALAFVNHAVSARNQLPILSYVLIQAEKNSLRLSTTDLEIAIQTTIECITEEEGVITIPAKVCLELISSLPSGNISLQTEEGKLLIKTARSRTTVQTMAIEEFPTLFDDLGETIFTMQPDAFKRALGRVIVSASDDSTRPALSGVLFQKKQNETLFVATDGYRLSLQTYQKEKDKEEKTEERAMLIPARILKEAMQLGGEGEVKIALSEKNNQALFLQEHTLLAGRVIEAEFPQYEKIIPSSYTTKAVFHTQDMQQAVKTVAIFARESNNIIHLIITKKGITVSSGQSSMGENSVDVEAVVEGEENVIAFNARYLLDLFSKIEEDEMVFEMTGPLSTGVFKIQNDPTFLHIIMPIRIER